MSTVLHILDENHKPIPAKDPHEWERFFFANRHIVERRSIGSTSGRSEVSTVFLGLDHGFGGEPRWFETMVFDGPMAGRMKRYATWDEAKIGHELMCEEVRAAMRRIKPIEVDTMTKKKVRADSEKARRARGYEPIKVWMPKELATQVHAFAKAKHEGNATAAVNTLVARGLLVPEPEPKKPEPAAPKGTPTAGPAWKGEWE